MRRTTLLGKAVVSVVCAALTLGTAACSGDDDPTSAPPPTTVVRSGAPPSLDHAVGAVADLDNLKCVHDARGVWAARGVLRNTTKKQVDYAVSVFVVRTKTGSVLGQASRVVRVSAGRTVPVTLDRVYRNEKTTGLRCVPHVERARA